MNRKILIALIGLLSVCLCGVLVLIAGGSVWWLAQARITPSRVAVPPTQAPLTLARPSPAAGSPTSAPRTPIPTRATTPVLSPLTANALARADIPHRDLYQIVPRLKKDLTLLTPIPTPLPRAWQIGERDQFFITEDMTTGTYRTASATLQFITPHALFWIEDTYKFDQAALQKSAEAFEKQIYPTDTQYFGEVPRGIDGETRIHIFNGKLDARTAGYYGSGDTYPRIFFPKSNQRNAIFMSLDAAKLGSDEYLGIIAHEFQHLIHHYQATHDTGWINEGMSELAMKLNNLPPGDLAPFARAPDTQLNTWSDEPQSNFAHYVASYLFFSYTAQRFGPDFSRAVIRAPRHGVYGIQATLDQRANGLRFEELFADWAVTNALNDPAVEKGRYAYENEKNFRITRMTNLTDLPTTRSLTTRQYAANYLTVQPTSGSVTITFTGTTTANLLPADAHGGKWVWYSNRADLSNMTLTRQFDLTRAPKATLNFWTWYEIERDYDYAYVEVSPDGGKTWDILPGKQTTTSNPGGASYGHAFTGRSGVPDGKSKDPARWMPEQVDLSPYAGKTILVRFEYITDDAVNLPGWAIDDITIPEINYTDDIESGEGGWQAAGFVRSDNVLPQQYIVQVIQAGAQARVTRLALDAQNRGSLTLAGFGKDVTKATLVITPFAPTTTEPAEYALSVVVK